MTIIERSRRAAEYGYVWTPEDHDDLMAHIREVEASWRRLMEYRESFDRVFRESKLRLASKGD